MTTTLDVLLADPDPAARLIAADQGHAPTKMLWYRRGNKKHAHHGRKGTRHCNHWFNVYRCPVCGREASHRRQPIICRGKLPT